MAKSIFVIAMAIAAIAAVRGNVWTAITALCIGIAAG